MVEQAFRYHEIVMRAGDRELDVEGLDDAVREAQAEITEYARVMSATRFPDLLAKGLQDRENALQRALDERERKLATRVPGGLGMDFSLRDEWVSQSVDGRREALAGLIDYIVIHPRDGAAIIWRGQAASLGPVPKQGSGQRTGSRSAITPFPWPLMEGETRVPLLQITPEAVRQPSSLTGEVSERKPMTGGGDGR